MELCQILYTENYKDTMSTLRDYLENKVYTEEALAHTEKALQLLASHYTTWQYRYTIIKHLDKDLFEELDWCELVALDNEKNYQIWNYRQRIIEDILALESASRFEYKREFPILRMMLEQDSKNHHVWSYRKWFVEKFGLFDDEAELEFVTNAIDEDLRNNSAWTHRFFLRASGSGFDKSHFDDEVEFCKARIDICPQNPSSWNYLVGMYRTTGRSLAELKQFCQKYGNVDQEKIASTFAVETLAKIAMEEKDVSRAGQLYEMLAEKYDPIRANYWKYMKERVEI